MAILRIKIRKQKSKILPQQISMLADNRIIPLPLHAEVPDNAAPRWGELWRSREAPATTNLDPTLEDGAWTQYSRGPRNAFPHPQADSFPPHATLSLTWATRARTIDFRGTNLKTPHDLSTRAPNASDDIPNPELSRHPAEATRPRGEISFAAASPRAAAHECWHAERETHHLSVPKRSAASIPALACQPRVGLPGHTTQVSTWLVPEPISEPGQSYAQATDGVLSVPHTSDPIGPATNTILMAREELAPHSHPKEGPVLKSRASPCQPQTCLDLPGQQWPIRIRPETSPIPPLDLNIVPHPHHQSHSHSSSHPTLHAYTQHQSPPQMDNILVPFDPEGSSAGEAFSKTQSLSPTQSSPHPFVISEWSNHNLLTLFQDNPGVEVIVAEPLQIRDGSSGAPEEATDSKMLDEASRAELVESIHKKKWMD